MEVGRDSWVEVGREFQGLRTAHGQEGAFAMKLLREAQYNRGMGQRRVTGSREKEVGREREDCIRSRKGLCIFF